MATRRFAASQACQLAQHAMRGIGGEDGRTRAAEQEEQLEGERPGRPSRGRVKSPHRPSATKAFGRRNAMPAKSLAWATGAAVPSRQLPGVDIAAEGMVGSDFAGGSEGSAG